MLLFSATWTVQRPGWVYTVSKKIKNVAGVYPVIPLSYHGLRPLSRIPPAEKA